MRTSDPPESSALFDATINFRFWLVSLPLMAALLAWRAEVTPFGGVFLVIVLPYVIGAACIAALVTGALLGHLKASMAGYGLGLLLSMPVGLAVGTAVSSLSHHRHVQGEREFVALANAVFDGDDASVVRQINALDRLSLVEAIHRLNQRKGYDWPSDALPRVEARPDPPLSADDLLRVGRAAVASDNPLSEKQWALIEVLQGLSGRKATEAIAPWIDQWRLALKLPANAPVQFSVPVQSADAGRGHRPVDCNAGPDFFSMMGPDAVDIWLDAGVRPWQCQFDRALEMASNARQFKRILALDGAPRSLSAGPYSLADRLLRTRISSIATAMQSPDQAQGAADVIALLIDRGASMDHLVLGQPHQTPCSDFQARIPDGWTSEDASINATAQRIRTLLCKTNRL
jgi:hypothetical protein